MSSRTAAARKRLQDPLLRVTPFISTSENLMLSNPPPREAPPMHTSNIQQLDLSNEFTQPLTSPEYPPTYYVPPSNTSLRDAPSMHTSNIQQLDLSNEFTQPLTSPEYPPTYYVPPSNSSLRDAPSMHTSNIQQLDLSNEFTQPLPSPEYSPTYHFPPSNHVKFQNIESSRIGQAASSSRPYSQAQWNHAKPKRIGSAQLKHAVPTHDPSPYEEDIRQRRPLLRVDPHVVNYQNLPPPPSPRLPSLTLASPATGSFPYVHNLPIPPKYPTPSLNDHSDHLPASYYPDTRRSNRHSLTPSDLPEYRSIYSSHMDGNIPVATSSFESTSKWRDNHYSSHQHASASASNLPAQLAAVSISPTSMRNESRFPFRNLLSAQSSIHGSSASSSHSSHERPRDSTSLSSVSSPSPSTPTSNGTWLPPAPPPSPTFYFPGSRSVARPKVSSKITNSQFKKRRSKSKLRRGSSQISPTSSISPSDAQSAFEMAPVSSTLQMPTQSNQQGTFPEEGSFVLSEDYKRKFASSVNTPPPEVFVFPTARSRAKPKISSKARSSKRSTYSSKSRDDTRGPSRFIETLFKRKSKAKTPNITPIRLSISNPVALSVPESTVSKGKRISVESTSTSQQERARNMKSRRGDYPLDPYNSVLLDNDRHTSELLSRINPMGSPCFHDYGTAPPSSVLDLGCGQGHWVLEAAVAWKAYGTHITGYDMVDISRSLLPWAAEQGVRDNIRFVRGNFLKNQLPFGSNTFDLVRMSCLGLCITSDSWGFILQEVCRVLITGGRLELIDDQMLFPYGKVSSLMDDTNSMVESVEPKLDFILSPMVSTFGVYGDVVNPGLGSTVGHRGSDDGSDLDGDLGALHGHKGRVTARISSVQPRVKPSIILDPEAWDRCVSISEDLEALFEHMLLDVFDIYKDSFEFVLPLMERVFGQAREVETMNLVLAPPNSSPKSELSPQQGLSHCPGLILWPSTFIPMDHTEIEIHAWKHLRTLLSCKNSLTQHAIEVAEDDRVDDEFISEALWEYESFLGHRFNPPVLSNEHSEPEESDTISIRNSIAESTNEAMWDIQSEFRQRYAWQPERPSNTSDTQHDALARTPSPPVASSSASGSSTTSHGLTHVRTFRVYEAVKLDNYTMTYDSH